MECSKKPLKHSMAAYPLASLHAVLAASPPKSFCATCDLPLYRLCSAGELAFKISWRPALTLDRVCATHIMSWHAHAHALEGCEQHAHSWEHLRTYQPQTSI